MNRFYKILTPFVILSLLVFIMPRVAHAQTTIFTTSDTWTAPAGVTTVQVSAWGGGAGGLSNFTGSGGGGGGAYAALNSFNVTPGNNYTVTVGPGGAISVVTGNDSMFNASSTLLAKGGSGPLGGTPTNGGIGGLAASSVGDVIHAGGNGGNVGGGGGGGGGGGAGSVAVGGLGGNGSSCTVGGAAGTGGSVGGGNGSAGASNSGNAAAPSAPGGGGGGASSASSCNGNTPAAGARGEVDITYTVTNTPAKIVVMSKMMINSKMQIN